MVVITEILPKSSPSSSSTKDHHNYKYEVFLSFRGADTRNSFTDHLYNALLVAGIVTFYDDEEIETGEPLKPELESAIKSSKASIIVLSANYASSTWCLDELALILEQQKNFNQIVIPIFYHVEPTHVRKQQSSFGDAMAKHEQRMETETDEEKRSQWGQKMASWKMALTEVANLKGKDVKDRKETELIDEVVTDIRRRLGVPLSNTLPPLIGMDSKIRFISSWLTDGSYHTADILTIVGIGGIGKTSLAQHVFKLHSRNFHKSSFVKDIDTICNERFNGLLDLQKQLHMDISKKTLLQVNDVSEYTYMIENALARKRVFIVLDDIGSLDQLDALLGNKGLHPASKIIITTKDASLTERCALFNPQVQPKHKKVLLNGLSEAESLEFLCINAFNSHMPEEGYKDVSKDLVKYCEGHPLALKVLGRSLQKQDVTYWEDNIKELKKEPHSYVKKALKMSIDSLPSENNELFKHIACFFVGIDKDVSETILNACDINTRSGIVNLIDRCLLGIGWDNKLMMHQLVQQMGRELVRQESPEKPWKRSRLWCHEESFKVLKQNKGKGNLLGLALDMRMLGKKKLRGTFELNTESFSQMDNLMLLQLNYVQLKGCFENIPEELRWLCMHGSPLKSIPLDLPMENLVALDLSYSNIETFNMSYSNPQPSAKRQKLLAGSCSEYTRLLGSLKILDLGNCEHLHTVGGFLELPALERLIVRKCISLIEVCESVEQCVELVHIDMSYCYNLKKVPLAIGKLKRVKTLLLDGCSLNESKIETIPSDSKLIALSLPSSLRRLSLSNNKLSNKSFPADFSCLPMLEELCLDCNPIVSMPNCVRSLPRLRKLSMDHCNKMILIEHPPPTLRELSIKSFDNKRSLRKIKFYPEMTPLTLNGTWNIMSNSSIEIDGIVKIQAMASVEKKVLHSLGWTNLDFIKENDVRRWTTYSYGGLGATDFETQMYYEFGIFSTFFGGDEFPNWISCRSKGQSISFTIPSSPMKLRGLNICLTLETLPENGFCGVPMIKVSNVTKNYTWIYVHFIEVIGNIDSKCCLSLLSHWMFGPNEMKAGDQITIIILHRYGQAVIKECGFGLVYDEDGKNEEAEEDALGYYKSWNHIIGGDLSAFQLTTGEYILDSQQYNRRSTEQYGRYTDFIAPGTTSFKERLRLKAFAAKKSV